ARDRGAAGDDREQVAPAAANAAAVLFDQALEGRAHLFLEGRRIVDVSRDAEELGTGVVFAAQPGEPGRAAPQDFGHDGDGFDVVDGGGAAVKAHAGRE